MALCDAHCVYASVLYDDEQTDVLCSFSIINISNRILGHHRQGIRTTERRRACSQ